MISITIEDDFDLDKIINSGQCFLPCRQKDGSYRFVTGTDSVVIKYDTEAKGSKPENGVRILASCSKKKWDDIWHTYFDLDTDYGKIRKSISKEDKFLTGAASLGRGIRILRQDKFEMLISFIISQRKSIPAIRTSLIRIVDMFGHEGFFPTPGELAAATDEQLSACGLGYRLPYVRDAANIVAHRDVDLDELEALSDEELFEKLKEFHGVGDKVANCVELFAYHRLSRAPVDTWIKKVINSEYGGVDPFGRYGKFAGVIQQYMFYRAAGLS